MLKIRFIVVERTKSPFLREGEAFYLERIRRYCSIDWIEVRPMRLKKGVPNGDILQKEELAITRRLVPGDYLVALDRSGRQYDSQGLSDWLKRLSTGPNRWVCFIIGGPVGLSKGIIDRADKVLSLSRLTFTHEMCRLFLVEQIYRAFTIMEGHKYHK